MHKNDLSNIILKKKMPEFYLLEILKWNLNILKYAFEL